ncbi:MAG: hypothetical protein JJU28_17705 [Cyclobacteriaceae bacterium]|nr:hypothetical protein [Cyclobacteriaceae bacterium]
MVKLLKFLRVFSILVFLAALLIVYAYFHDQRNLQLNPAWEHKVGIEMFFYTSLLIFSLFNILMLMISRLTVSVGVSAGGGGLFKSDERKQFFVLWVESFALALNVAFISIIAYIGFLNSPAEYNLKTYTLIIYLGPLAILFSLIIPLLGKWK